LGVESPEQTDQILHSVGVLLFPAFQRSEGGHFEDCAVVILQTQDFLAIRMWKALDQPNKSENELREKKLYVRIIKNPQISV
jgi:hypothetical protein